MMAERMVEWLVDMKVEKKEFQTVVLWAGRSDDYWVEQMVEAMVDRMVEQLETQLVGRLVDSLAVMWAEHLVVRME